MTRTVIRGLAYQGRVGEDHIDAARGFYPGCRTTSISRRDEKLAGNIGVFQAALIVRFSRLVRRSASFTIAMGIVMEMFCVVRTPFMTPVEYY
jgi:hypothetical protein